MDVENIAGADFGNPAIDGKAVAAFANVADDIIFFGFAPGIERLIMVLLGIDNIREVVPFPKNSQAQDLMMGAPGEVDPEQLKELGIRIQEKES